tara:strand:+ start:3052 stop:3843 length:792 start_codon:yes stop_codon:yes gene_type:complete
MANKQKQTETKPTETKPAEVTEVKRVIKRRRRKKGKGKQYFTQETEDAIVEYNGSEDVKIRNDIYNERIRYAFDKLAENILNTFKFSYFQCSHEEVQQEVVSNLVGNIHKYKQQNGKAFSYFSIIAKNFLILYNNGNYKKFKRHMSVDDDEIVYERKELTVNPKNEVKRKEINEFIKLMIDYYDINLEKMFKKPQELKIAAAVVEIFRRCDSIENFNKKAIYLYIREMTDCKTQNITKVVNKMRDVQRTITKSYFKNGYIDKN